jgi:hypothetical protein
MVDRHENICGGIFQWIIWDCPTAGYKSVSRGSFFYLLLSVENGWRDCVGESELKVGATTLPRTVPFPFFESCRKIWNCCRQVSAETSPSYQDSFTLIRLQEEVNWEVGKQGYGTWLGLCYAVCYTWRAYMPWWLCLILRTTSRTIDTQQLEVAIEIVYIRRSKTWKMYLADSFAPGAHVGS